MSVYYWAVYRPDLMPVCGRCFLIGLLQDLLVRRGRWGVGPLDPDRPGGGLWISAGSSHGKSFSVVWLGHLLWPPPPPSSPGFAGCGRFG